MIHIIRERYLLQMILDLPHRKLPPLLINPLRTESVCVGIVRKLRNTFRKTKYNLKKNGLMMEEEIDE